MMTSTQLSNQEPYLTIHADGKITVSEKLQPSETAARVLECIKTQWMEYSQSKQIRELQERIKRLEDAGDYLCAAAAFMGWHDKIETWNKSKEVKP